MSQIIKKFVGDDQIGATKIELENDSALKSRNAADSGDVNMFKVDASDIINAMGSLNPSSNGSFELGDDTHEWSNVHAQLVKSVGGLTIKADAAPLILESSTAVDVIDPSNTIALPLRLYNAAGTFYTALKAAALSASYTLTFPVDDGTTGQVMTTNGSGVLSWTTPSGSSSINNKETFTLSGTDITNQYIDLAQVAKVSSIIFMVKGSGYLLEGASYDYSVNLTGGAGGKTRITFLNDLATGGVAALVAADILQIQYQY